ncbi:MAG: carboxypeptidase regulatory-like domain-containing protein, partial [bacterium]|nr:carboxypeptidase regulatory-like domain-containing protein [bacterium]
MACLALAITIPAVAQVRHGAVEGTVHEPGGAGLPGVTVVLSGDNMMGERTEVTGGDGSFRIQLVPPGLYSLEASLAGM